MGGPEAVAEVKVEVPAAPDTPTEGEDVKNEDVIEPVQENEVVDDSSPEEAPVPIDAPEVEESPIVNEDLPQDACEPNCKCPDGFVGVEPFCEPGSGPEPAPQSEVEDTELKADKELEEVEEPLIVPVVAATTGEEGPQESVVDEVEEPLLVPGVANTAEGDGTPESVPEEVGEPLIVGEVDEPLLVAKVATTSEEEQPAVIETAGDEEGEEGPEVG